MGWGIGDIATTIGTGGLNFAGGFNQSGKLGDLSSLNPFGGSYDAGTQTTTSEPWKPQQEYLTDMFGKARNQANMGGQPNQYETDAMNGIAGMQNQNNPYLSVGNQFGSQGNSYIDKANPYSGIDNPFLAKSVDYASQAAMRNLQPMNNQAQAQSGAFGNSGVAETYGRAAADTLGGISNNAYMNEYGAQRDMAQRNLENQRGIYQNNLNSQRDTAQNNINSQRNFWGQDASRKLDANKQLYSMGSDYRNIPWQNIQNYRNAIGGDYGGTRSTPLRGNKTQETLGILGTVAGIGKAAYGSASGGGFMT